MPTKKHYTSHDLNNNKITGLATPTDATDAATKSYVDSKPTGSVNSVNNISPVTGNVTLSATNIAITDTNNNFTTDTVQGAIDELFQFANSGKTQIATAIGSPAQATDSFSTLAGYISALSSPTYGVLKNVQFDETIAKGNPIVSSYKTWSESKLSLTALPSQGLASAYSSDSRYLAMGYGSGANLNVYRVNGDTYTAATLSGTALQNNCKGVAFSSDTTYLACAITTTPFIGFYKRSGDTFTRLGNPSTLPTAVTGNCVAWSPDMVHVAIGHSGTETLTIYKRSGDTFTKLSSGISPSLPSGEVQGVAFSPNGNYLACAHINSPFITIYQRSGDTFTKIANPATLPNVDAGGSKACVFSPDSQYLYLAHAASPFFYIYKFNGSTFEKLDNPASLPPNSANGIAVSPDGAYVSIAHSSTPFVTVYKRNGDSFSKNTAPSSLPAGTGNSTSFSADGNYYVIGHATSPFFSVYKNTSSTYLFVKESPTAAIGSLDKIIGVAKEDGTTGQTKQADIIVGAGLLP